MASSTQLTCPECFEPFVIRTPLLSQTRMDGAIERGCLCPTCGMFVGVDIPPADDLVIDLEAVARRLITLIGDDPNREGLAETPRRFAAFWTEFVRYDPGTTDTTFEAVSTDQMVVVSGMRVWSMCEHHLLPFWCDITVGYIAQDRVLGLSKFARIAQACAHKLQLQERLVTEIGDEVARITGTDNIAVIGRGEHLCMVMRGIRSEHLMSSSYTRGLFRDDPRTREEFLMLAFPR